MRILITGGAGFIGSHTADALISLGHSVRILDNLNVQVHGKTDTAPSYLHPDVEFIKGDIRDRHAVKEALKDIEIVYHFAAETGVGQSMYELERYYDVNVRGTASLLQAMIEADGTIHRLILSSSRAVYGEGKYYSNERGVEVYPDSRKMEQLAIGDWNIYEGTSVAPLSAMATDENSKISPQSAYALTKAFQEAMVENFCKTRNISYVVLRYFNVYGQRQSLCNPYIGVASIFCTRLINRNPVVLYEDGTPIRDFVHVKDVVTANLLALNPKVTNEVFNVGSGQPLSLYDVGVCLVREFGLDEDKFLKRSKMYRIGDIRSCYANIQKIQTRLQYFPTVTFSDGARELINWVIDESKRQTVQDQHSAVEQLMVQKKILLKSSN